ncbi:MAG TPA: hypothetical protein VGR20_09490 [Acidimicrobiia bacterium]|nr:hypothetical protein [Acidimicrobiia bacterium]
MRPRPVALVLLGALLAPMAPSASAGSGAGDLDPGFGRGGKVLVKPPVDSGEWPGGQAVQPDGAIVVVGTAAPARNGYAFLLLRFLPDGKLDPSFGTGGRVWTDLVTLGTPLRGAVTGDVALGSSSASAVVVQPDGRIVVGGTTQSGGTTAFAVMRYLPDGHPDPAFGSDGLALTDFDAATNDSVTALSLLADGRILAAGAAGSAVGLARYLPDGRLDTSFGPAGNGTVTTTRGLLNALGLNADPGGRLLVAGQAGTPGGPFDFGLARYSGDGVLDDSFGDRGVVETDLGSTGEWPAGVVPGPAGTVIVAGASGSSFALLRYGADGKLDPTFGTGGVSKAGPDLGGAHAVIQLPDGRLLLAGERLAGDFREVALARYHPDGVLDSGFGTGGVVGTDVSLGHDDGAAAVLYPGGGLVVAGTTLDQQNLHPAVFLVRYAAVDG